MLDTGQVCTVATNSWHSAHIYLLNRLALVVRQSWLTFQDGTCCGMCCFGLNSIKGLCSAAQQAFCHTARNSRSGNWETSCREQQCCTASILSWMLQIMIPVSAANAKSSKGYSQCYLFDMVDEIPGTVEMLKDVLEDEGIIKVLHDCRQDAAALQV